MSFQGKRHEHQGKSRGLSTKEEAEPTRFNKKVKGIHHANFMDDIAITEKESPWGKAHSRHRLSFKEKLVGELPGAYRRAFDLVD